MSQDSRLSSSWYSFLETQYRASVRSESCRLDGVLSDRKTAGVASQTQDAFQYPVSKVLQARAFRLLLAIVLVVPPSFGVQMALEDAAIPGTAFRFTALDQRGNVLAPDTMASFEIRTECAQIEHCNTTTTGAY
eukprot:1986157-Rhodomonas_salina.1